MFRLFRWIRFYGSGGFVPLFRVLVHIILQQEKIIVNQLSINPNGLNTREETY